MSLTLCCQYLLPKTKRDKSIEYYNGMNEKSLQYNRFVEKKYSKQNVIDVWENNISSLNTMLPTILKDGIKAFRLSSSLLPLFDMAPEDYKSDSKVNDLLKTTGKFILDNNMRLIMHPDQFVVLSSNNENVIKNSISILEHHNWILDNMNLPANRKFLINIHGGVKGNSDILLKSIEKLSDNCRNRLVFENDEKAYSVNDLYKVYKSSGCSITFDSHHHTFNEDNLSSEDAMNLAISTWEQGIKPSTHISNTSIEFLNDDKASFKDKRKHSDYIHYLFDHQIKANNDGLIDIDVEAKMKNLAIKDLVNKFSVKI